MKALIDFLCSIYFAIAAGLAIALMSNAFFAGLLMITPWVLVIAAVMYITGAAYGVFTGLHKEPAFVKILLGCLVFALILILQLGVIVTMFEVGDAVTNVTKKFPNFGLDEFSNLVSAVIFICSVVPVLCLNMCRSDTFVMSTTVCKQSDEPIKKDLLKITSSFLTRKGNRIIVIGRTGTGKSVMLNALVKSEDIISDRKLGFFSTVMFDADTARKQLTKLSTPIAIDEGNVLAHAGILLPGLKLLNSVGVAYVISLQSLSLLSDELKDEIFCSENAVKIIYLKDEIHESDLEKITWEELTRYEAEKL